MYKLHLALSHSPSTCFQATFAKLTELVRWGVGERILQLLLAFCNCCIEGLITRGVWSLRSRPAFTSPRQRHVTMSMTTQTTGDISEPVRALHLSWPSSTHRQRCLRSGFRLRASSHARSSPYRISLVNLRKTQHALAVDVKLVWWLLTGPFAS